MEYKQKNENGGSGSYQRMKYVDKQNQKYQKAANASVLPAVMFSTGITQTNVSWYYYCKKFGVNETHTSGLDVAWKKEGASFKLPPTHPFILNMTGKCYGGNKQSSFYTSTSVPPKNIVTYYMNHMSNKELIRKTQNIFDDFYITTWDTDIATVIEKLSGV